MEDGWHVVRYGRRRQRTRAPPGDWSHERAGWKARACYPSRTRRDQFPYHNQPAPPPGAAYFFSPQTRSYAAVTRQGPQRNPWGRRGNFSRDRLSEGRREAADPQLGGLIRKLYKVVRMVHHLQNVAPRDDKPPPRMIDRMVDTLAGMIKPAVPSRRTMDLIEGNARNWGYTTCVILKEHYETSLEESLGDIAGGPTTGWKEAFQVASRWAKRNLPRITRAVLDHAEAVITARLEGEGQPQPRASQLVPQQPQTPSLVQQPSVPQPLVLLPPVQTARKKPTVSVATNTSQMFDWTLVSPHRETPQTQRAKSRSQRTVSSQRHEAGTLPMDSDPPQQDLDDHDLLLVPERTASQLELEKIFDELQAEEEREEAEALATQTAATRVDLISGDDAVDSEEEIGDEDEQDFESSFDYSRPRTMYRVKRHNPTTNKMVDWNLEVHKKWVILGDSNLSRCPNFTHPDLQVESFPGATFRHAESFIRRARTRPGLVVEKVVLSLGINSRMNKPKETTIKNLQAAIRAIRSTFPYAQYWIALTNFSPELDEVEKQNLLVLNEHIHKNMPFIPLLPDQFFETESDQVHWTPETAQAMLDHWMNYLF